MQPNVADAARRNIAKWGLTERVRIETGDIRERVPDERMCCNFVVEPKVGVENREFS